jgi:ribosomal protein S18 acetylase RimI-like enzyme
MVEFRKAITPDEIEALCDFDRKAFHRHPQDLFTREQWEEYESHWMIVDGQIVGCSAFVHNVDYDDQARPGCLFIVSTGVAPESQGKGFGNQQKAWQIEYAKQHGFTTIVTNMRQSNERIIRLNQKFGFTTRKIDPGYYDDEPAVVMELDLTNAYTCPQCGKPLRTPRAKQCRFCNADWHLPS